jgi:hypothetical protein
MSTPERFFKRQCLQAASIALMLLAFTAPAQNPGTRDSPALLSSGGGRAPLVLFISGPGQVLPYHDGQLLEVGADYRMLAIPNRGAVFAGWNQVNLFVTTVATIDGAGYATNVTSTDISPMPISVRSPFLRFTVQPTNVLEEIPGYLSIKQITGWQANFVRR